MIHTRRYAAVAVLAIAVTTTAMTPHAATAADAGRHAATDRKIKRPLDGSWAGKVKGDSLPYSLNATFQTTDGVPSATVAYPELSGCSGDWAYQGGKSEIRFVETITNNPGGACLTNSNLTVLDLQGKRLLVQYDYSGVNVRALLRPQPF